MSPSVVLVTGAASGIGLTIAREFAAKGCRVHVCDESRDAIDAMADSDPGIGTTLCDVSDVRAVDALFDDVAGRFGRLDVLINNAGIAGPTARVEHIDPDDWDRTVAVDLSAAFYCARRAIPMLKSSPAGSILNLLSSAAFFGFPLRAPYASCKWGLIGLTKTLAMELGPDGIRVNAICPGSVEGPRIDRVIEADARERGMTPEEIRRTYLRQSSMRAFVSPRDVAALALFLASADARLISGQIIGVDGHTESLSTWLDE
ncbi:MAG: SDR family oxidoreductase [Woeseiaceae bacterium]|nr:SDR family oxidoreductase [Woeseiaceae bacterium]